MRTLEEIDAVLGPRYGAYASYATDADPTLIDTYGDGPAAEVDRLLDRLVGPHSRVLDLGCGAGFTLCRLAPRVASIWGLDSDADLLSAARARVAALGVENATLVHGTVAEPEHVSQLPDDTFDLVLSRRGPNVNRSLLPKLTPDALVVQELFQDPLGLLEAFGRKTFVADIGDNPQWLVDTYSWLGLLPVSVKSYYFDSFFRDAAHLAAYLSQPTQRYSWPMPAMPYREDRDRPALELYVRYNTRPKGIRIVNHRKVYLFRRERVQFAPVAPDVEPLE